MLIWILLVVTFVVIAILILAYLRLSLPHKGGVESWENSAAVQAYDRISRWPLFRFLRRLIIRELMEYHPAGTIVDVGCGPGHFVTLIAKSLPQSRIIGVDISAEMILLASHNLSSHGLGKRVEFRQGDVERLPFADNTIDFVVSTLSLHHWQHPEQALRETHRVLKPGGQFLIFDLRRDSRRWFYWLLRFAQTFLVPAAMRQAGEPSGSVFSSYTPTELETLLSKASLQQTRIKAGLGWMFAHGYKG